LTLVTTFWFPKFFLTSAGPGAVSLIGRDGLDIHGYRNREDRKMAIITREFGLALKVQLGMSEPISNRAIRLMQSKERLINHRRRSNQCRYKATSP
jgi:hypothetical protein